MKKIRSSYLLSFLFAFSLLPSPSYASSRNTFFKTISFVALFITKLAKPEQDVNNHLVTPADASADSFQKAYGQDTFFTDTNIDPALETSYGNDPYVAPVKEDKISNGKGYNVYHFEANSLFKGSVSKQRRKLANTIEDGTLTFYFFDEDTTTNPPQPGVVNSPKGLFEDESKWKWGENPTEKAITFAFSLIVGVVFIKCGTCCVCSWCGFCQPCRNGLIKKCGWIDCCGVMKSWYEVCCTNEKMPCFGKCEDCCCKRNIKNLQTDQRDLSVGDSDNEDNEKEPGMCRMCCQLVGITLCAWITCAPCRDFCRNKFCMKDIIMLEKSNKNNQAADDTEIVTTAS